MYADAAHYYRFNHGIWRLSGFCSELKPLSQLSWDLALLIQLGTRPLDILNAFRLS